MFTRSLGPDITYSAMKLPVNKHKKKNFKKTTAVGVKFVFWIGSDDGNQIRGSHVVHLCYGCHDEVFYNNHPREILDESH